MCIRDRYVPATDDETGTLSLVRVEDPEEQVFLAVNEPETMVRRALERAEGFWLLSLLHILIYHEYKDAAYRDEMFAVSTALGSDYADEA